MAASETKAAKTTQELGKQMAVAFDSTKINAAKTEAEKFNKAVAAGEAPVKSLRSQLKDLKAQLAETDDDEEFLKLSIEAGRLQDKIEDASQAARIFATGTPLHAFVNGRRGVAGDLINMDFEGAAKKSQLLVKASQQITFKGSIDAVKHCRKFVEPGQHRVGCSLGNKPGLLCLLSVHTPIVPLFFEASIRPVN